MQMRKYEKTLEKKRVNKSKKKISKNLDGENLPMVGPIILNKMKLMKMKTAKRGRKT